MSLSTFEFFLKKSQNIAIFCDKLRFFEIFCDFLQEFAKICNKLQKSSNIFEVCLFMVSSWNYLKLFELFWQILRSLMWKCITSYFCPMDYVVLDLRVPIHSPKALCVRFSYCTGANPPLSICPPCLCYTKGLRQDTL